MYQAHNNDNMLQSLTALDGSCCVIFCTTAFGIGVDIPNNSITIHYGPSSDIRRGLPARIIAAGRDGRDCDAILYVYSACTVGHVSPAIKEYCPQTT